MCIFAWNWRGGSSSNEKHDFSQAYFCLKQHAKCRYGKKHITHWGMKFILACILCFYMEMYENILLTCSLSFSIWFFIIIWLILSYIYFRWLLSEIHTDFVHTDTHTVRTRFAMYYCYYSFSVFTYFYYYLISLAETHTDITDRQTLY